MIARKKVNALILGATPNWSAMPNEATHRVTAKVQQRLGGLWVGGILTLDEKTLAFAPDAVNARLYSNDCSWALPLSAIENVDRRFGWLTGLVDIKDTAKTRTVRCFGANAFATMIRAEAVRHR